MSTANNEFSTKVYSSAGYVGLANIRDVVLGMGLKVEIREGVLHVSGPRSQYDAFVAVIERREGASISDAGIDSRWKLDV